MKENPYLSNPNMSRRGNKVLTNTFSKFTLQTSLKLVDGVTSGPIENFLIQKQRVTKHFLVYFTKGHVQLFRQLRLVFP